MKKLFVLICMLFIISGCSCSSNQTTRAKNFKPSEFLPLEEVTQHLSYEPVATEDNSKVIKSITYKSADVGKGDIVRVELSQKKLETDTSKIKAQFDNVRQKNEEYESLVMADDLGADAFISIPAIHLYKNGYYLKITAGSGAGEEQITLLKDLGRIALENMEKLLPKE